METWFAAGLVALVVMGPWVVRNLTTFDEPTVLGTGFAADTMLAKCPSKFEEQAKTGQ